MSNHYLTTPSLSQFFLWRFMASNSLWKPLNRKFTYCSDSYTRMSYLDNSKVFQVLAMTFQVDSSCALFYPKQRVYHVIIRRCLTILAPQCLAWNNMASKVGSVLHKLHAVTLIRSPIGQPWWEKRTVKFLGLNKLHKTVIVKNTATMNGQLQAIKHLIDVKPIEVVEDNSSTKEEGVFLRENGKFHLSKFDVFLKNNPRVENVIRARRKQVMWENKRRR